MAKKEAFQIVKKRNGRYAVKTRGGKAVNGDAKVKVLAEKGLIKKMKAKPKEEAPAEASEASES